MSFGLYSGSGPKFSEYAKGFVTGLNMNTDTILFISFLLDQYPSLNIHENHNRI